MKRILVLGAGGNAGINFCESVKAGGEPVEITGLDMDPRFLVLNDALTRTWVSYPPNSKDWLPNLNQAIKSDGVEFVHAQPDPEVKALSDHRDEVEAKTFLPSKDAVDTFQDKLKSSQLLYCKGMAPRTVPIRWQGEQLDIESLRFMLEEGPVWIRSSGGAGGSASTPAWTVEQVEAWVSLWDRVSPGMTFIAQPALGVDPEEGNYACQMIFREGDLFVSQTWQRLRYIMYPASPSRVSGTPSVAKIVNRVDINAYAESAIRELDKRPNGVYSVDFKEHLGNLYVTEVNPGRFFTPSLMYVKAGFNLPHIYLRLAYGDREMKYLRGALNPCRPEYLWIRGIDVRPKGWSL